MCPKVRFTVMSRKTKQGFSVLSESLLLMLVNLSRSTATGKMCPELYCTFYEDGTRAPRPVGASSPNTRKTSIVNPYANGGKFGQYKMMQITSLKPWSMGTHLRVLGESYPMNDNMTGLEGFQKSLCFGQK